MKAWERLINYVTVRTPSDEESETVPSSVCQFDLARKLEKEMKELGLTEVVLDDKCYLYGKLPATEGKKEIPALGFIAHMDTVSDFCDHEIRPMVTENYDGGDLVLGTSGLVLSPKEFPHLTGLKGRTLLTSDGTTILGADDKAGIAEILTMIERIQTENRPHGTICVAFTPDEEIGMGAEHFNLDQFGAEYAYTLDGDSEGEIQYENFNACKAEFEIRGFNVHPGEGKDTMINASLVAIEINNCLPAMETPRGTEDYEGFLKEGDFFRRNEALLRDVIRERAYEISEQEIKGLNEMSVLIYRGMLAIMQSDNDKPTVEEAVRKTVGYLGKALDAYQLK